MKIKIKKIRYSRLSEIDWGNLGFGKYFSDHIFIADFDGKSWDNPRIIPYGKLDMSPGILALHYGQSVFEGMKAYRYKNDDIYLFRPLDNFRRLNLSAERMAMAEIPEDLFMEGLSSLLRIDKQWIPAAKGCSLYIRPLLFATDEEIGVKISNTYRFILMTSPVGAYYSEPLKVLVETKYSRAAPGGVGLAKAAGNYGSSLLPTRLAHEKGYNQVLWTDSCSHSYLEESGTMNVMCVMEDVLVTPKLSDTILKGVTRDSVLAIARDLGIKTEERKISIDEVISAHKKGILREMFGVGTAVVITPICLFGYNGKNYELPVIATEKSIGTRIKKELDGIRAGKIPDTRDWMQKV